MRVAPSRAADDERQRPERRAARGERERDRRAGPQPAELREIGVVGRELAQHLVPHLLDERRPPGGDDLLRPREARVDRRAPAQPPLGDRRSRPGDARADPAVEVLDREIERCDVRVCRHEHVEQHLGELGDAPRPPGEPRQLAQEVELPAGDDRRRPQQRHEHRADARRGDDDERHGPRSVPCAPDAAQRGGCDAAARDDDRVAALPEEADCERDHGEGAAERDARSDGDVEGHDHRDRQQACRQPSRPERRGQRGAHPQPHMRQPYVSLPRGGGR